LQLFLGSLGLTTFVLAEFHKFIPLRYLARPLIIGWLISGTIFHTYYQQHVMRDQMRLRSLAREYTSRIENQFQLHRRALRASSGLFTANDNMTRREWKIFTDTLDIKLRFRAMLGIGYIKPVHKSEVAAYEKQQRQLYSDFTIKPVRALTVGSERIKSDWSYIIEFLEPEELASAIGLDVATEKYRFDAANMARDTGYTTLSRNISLRISKNKGAGFLLFVPVYKFGWPVKTIEERRAAHKGWMYAPLLMQDLVTTSMEGSKAELDYEVYLKVDDRKLLLTTSHGFFSNNPRNTPLVTETNISNQTFIIQWQPNANFISSRDFTLSWVGAMGVLLTLATAWMLMNSQTFMARAEAIVQDQTKLISERNHLWQALMESAPVGVMHVDITGDWRYANSKWYELMGSAKNRAEFLSETVPKIHWADREHFNKIWESYLKSGTDIHTEFRLVQHDGSMKWLIVSATGIINDEGQRVGHVCVAIDQTQQKEQALLLEKERARMVESAKMASLGEMAGGMAHEINNPLTIILARSEQLRRMQFEKITREFINEQTAKIESTAQRIAKIVRGLRAFSRNAENDEMVPSSIKSIMDDTLSLCSEKIKINHINLSVSDLKDWQILCRPSEISQVLLNLITNAFDAISGQPDPWIRIEVHVNSGNLVIRVTDSGTGIPFQVADKIMTPFFTTKEVGKGTGLGLSISKGIVELHGGSLRLDRQNANTSFVIELPLHA
ncbi:MAG: CHASE domain-containing protein, partial [Bdellovibrionota bacterium]